jgi:hypothetical protein
MAEFDQTKFDDSLNKFYNKLDTLMSSVGRGQQKAGAKGTGPVPRAKSVDPSEKANRIELDKSTKSLRAKRVQTDADIKASKEAIDTQKDLTKEQEKAILAQETITDSFKNLGKGLTSANANLGTIFDSFGDRLVGTGTVFGKVVGGFALGAGYAIGGLQEFAKQASQMGSFADLDKFSVGSVTQMKLMSGLGNAFIKVIESSNGTFKAFGATSQQAAENLSNLSRGLKYGSGYLNATLRKSLGTDLVKSVDRAARAARSMGITDEEQAKLTGELAVSAAMGAKTEEEATQRLAQQYTKTIDSTKVLTNAFGITKEAALEAAAAFRKTDAGTFAGMAGKSAETAALSKLMQEMGIAKDSDQAARAALGVMRGDEGGARFAIGAGPQNRNMDLLLEAGRRAGGFGDMAAVTREMKNLAPQMDEIIQDANAQAVVNPKYAEAGGQLARFKNQMMAADAGDKDQKTPKPRTSETDNIMAMNSLTAALESLRNVILGVTAGIATLVGSIGAIVAMGGIGGILTAGLGSKIGDMLVGGAGKAADWAKNTRAGSWISGKMGSFTGAGSAALDKLSGAAGKGMEGFGEMLGKLGESKTVKGAATLALLGSALALTAVGLKTFNEVNWGSLVKGTIALGGLISMARLVGEATTGMIKGAAVIALLGASLWIAGKGFQSFSDVEWEGIAKGVVALGAFGAVAAIMGTFIGPILLGSVAIAGLGIALGVFGAGAYVAGQAADVFANAIKKVGDVDGANLIAVGAGLAAVGAGAVVFAAGMVAATATSLVTGLMSLFGAKSPMEKILELVPVADKISMIGEGMFKFGSSIGLINDNLQSLDLDALNNFKNALVEISNIDMPSLNGLSIPQISTDGLAGATQQQGNGLSSILNGNSAVTPEVIAQLMSYLSSIENDLAAIRGNTRKNGYESPVRLS